MDIHKPKPIHSWREFLKEVGIIVLGVGIALAAEQAVEWWHWKGRIRDAGAAMQIELSTDNGPQAYTRLAITACLGRQLDELEDAINAGRSRQDIAAMISQYKPPIRTWDSVAWSAIIASDVGSHIPPQQTIKWGLPYVFVERLQTLANRELERWSTLRLSHHGAAQLSPDEAEALLARIDQFRQDNRGFRLVSDLLLSAMQANGITVAPEEQRHILSDLRMHFHDCVVAPSVGGTNSNDQTSFLHQK